MAGSKKRRAKAAKKQHHSNNNNSNNNKQHEVPSADSREASVEPEEGCLEENMADEGEEILTPNTPGRDADIEIKENCLNGDASADVEEVGSLSPKTPARDTEPINGGMQCSEEVLSACPILDAPADPDPCPHADAEGTASTESVDSLPEVPVIKEANLPLALEEPETDADPSSTAQIDQGETSSEAVNEHVKSNSGEGQSRMLIETQIDQDEDSHATVIQLLDPESSHEVLVEADPQLKDSESKTLEDITQVNTLTSESSSASGTPVDLETQSSKAGSEAEAPVDVMLESKPEAPVEVVLESKPEAPGEVVLESKLETPASVGVIETVSEAPASVDVTETVPEAPALVGDIETVSEAPASVDVTETVPEAPASVDVTETEPEAPASVDVTESEPEASASVDFTETEPEAPASVDVTESEPEASASVDVTETEPEAPVLVDVTETEPEADVTKKEPEASASVYVTEAEQEAPVMIHVTEKEPKAPVSINVTEKEPETPMSIDASETEAEAPESHGVTEIERQPPASVCVTETEPETPVSESEASAVSEVTESESSPVFVEVTETEAAHEETIESGTKEIAAEYTRSLPEVSPTLTNEAAVEVIGAGSGAMVSFSDEASVNVTEPEMEISVSTEAVVDVNESEAASPSAEVTGDESEAEALVLETEVSEPHPDIPVPEAVNDLVEVSEKEDPSSKSDEASVEETEPDVDASSAESFVNVAESEVVFPSPEPIKSSVEFTDDKSAPEALVEVTESEALVPFSEPIKSLHEVTDDACAPEASLEVTESEAVLPSPERIEAAVEIIESSAQVSVPKLSGEVTENETVAVSSDAVEASIEATKVPDDLAALNSVQVTESEMESSAVKPVQRLTEVVSEPAVEVQAHETVSVSPELITKSDAEVAPPETVEDTLLDIDVSDSTCAESPAQVTELEANTSTPEVEVVSEQTDIVVPAQDSIAASFTEDLTPANENTIEEAANIPVLQVRDAEVIEEAQAAEVIGTPDAKVSNLEATDISVGTGVLAPELIDAPAHVTETVKCVTDTSVETTIAELEGAAKAKTDSTDEIHTPVEAEPVADVEDQEEDDKKAQDQIAELSKSDVVKGITEEAVREFKTGDVEQVKHDESIPGQQGSSFNCDMVPDLHQLENVIVVPASLEDSLSEQDQLEHETTVSEQENDIGEDEAASSMVVEVGSVRTDFDDTNMGDVQEPGSEQPSTDQGVVVFDKEFENSLTSEGSNCDEVLNIENAATSGNGEIMPTQFYGSNESCETNSLEDEQVTIASNGTKLANGPLTKVGELNEEELYNERGTYAGKCKQAAVIPEETIAVYGLGGKAVAFDSPKTVKDVLPTSTLVEENTVTSDDKVEIVKVIDPSNYSKEASAHAAVPSQEVKALYNQITPAASVHVTTRDQKDSALEQKAAERPNGAVTLARRRNWFGCCGLLDMLLGRDQ